MPKEHKVLTVWEKPNEEDKTLPHTSPVICRNLPDNVVDDDGVGR